MQIREKRQRANGAARFFIFIIAVGAVVVALVLALAFLPKLAAPRIGQGDANLNPAERTLLAAYLAAHAAELEQPAGDDPTPVVVTIDPGTTASGAADHLATLGFIHDPQLLTYYMIYQGIDSQVEAGDFILRLTMTPREVAAALTDARAREVQLRVVEGWRREQIAESLANGSFAGIAADFLARTGPASQHPGQYSFLRELPPGASLEGFLFPDTYLVRPNASVGDVLDKMLANFEARLPADFGQQAAAHGLTLFQAVTLASLIEREAVVDEERPIIASVIYNRLAAGQRLEIDAATQYVVGQQGAWWPRLDGLDLRAIDSPYNTYVVTGLPPGPVANPGLSSILAAGAPAQTDYLYYRALCDGSGRHAFAVTYDEHLANAC